MNILYVSPMLIDYENLDGVARKLLFQCEALGSISENDRMYLASFFSNEYYAIRCDGYEKELKFVNKNSKQLNMFQIYPQLPEVCKELHIDAIYFRMMSLSWVTEKFFKELKKQSIKIVVEIPTYPFWKEKWLDAIDCIKSGKVARGIKRCGTNIIYWLYAHRLKNYIEAIVTFSNISELWGIRVIGIANGYQFTIPEKATKLKKPDEPIHMLMVASLRANHGTDRIIQGLIQYYTSGNKRNIIFDIVGDGDIVPSLKEMVYSHKEIKDKVIFHGFMSGKLLENMYSMADIGISALAFHRLGVTYCSPLKSKEYFAKGLPVVGTTAEHDILKSDCNRYYFAASENDIPIEIDKVLSFYNTLENDGVTDKDIIVSASRNFSWKMIMKPIYEAMK